MATQLPLLLALLLVALPGQADDTPSPPHAAITADRAHPDFLRLEKDLTVEQSKKKSNQVTPEQYREWLIKYRTDLDATAVRVPPSPDNTAAHARITALLGESGQARAALSQALESNPGNPVLLRTKGQILYDQQDFPGATRDGLEAWEKSGRTDKAAWELYQASKGRIAPSRVAPSPSRTPGPAAVATDDSNKPYKLAVKGQAHAGDVPTPGFDQTPPAGGAGNSPLWPLAVPFAGGLIAYGVYRGTKQNDSSKSAPSTEALAPGGLLVSANSGPARAAAKVIKEALFKAAPEAAGSVVITVATIGIIVAAGVATIYGLNEMIAAQDKYNEAIDTHRDDHPRERYVKDKSSDLTSTARSSGDDPCDINLDRGQLKNAGILGSEHRVKSDALQTNKNLSKFDLCGCNDGRVVVKFHGCKGPIIAPTGHTWK